MKKQYCFFAAILWALALAAQPRLDSAPNLEPVVVTGYKTPLVQTDYCGQGPIITQLASNRLPATAEHLSRGNLASVSVSWWNDQENWPGWCQSLQRDFQAESKKWPLLPRQRYRLQLSGQQGQPVRHARAALIGMDGSVLWRAVADAQGQAELWSSSSQPPRAIRVEYQGQRYEYPHPQPFEHGENALSLPVGCQLAQGIDLVALIDATQSMQDEFAGILLALEQADAALRQTLPGYRSGITLFRDYGERYLTRSAPLGPESPFAAKDFLWRAAGGGGEAEPLDTALMAALHEHDWRPEADARILLLFTDAQPANASSTLARLDQALRLAAAKGITLIPVACSGLGQEGEFLLRSLAIATNGCYAYLTGGTEAVLHRHPIIAGNPMHQALGNWLLELPSLLTPLPPCAQVVDAGSLSGTALPLHCYPNPATTELWLELPAPARLLSAYNEAGQLVFQQSDLAAGACRVDVSTWEPGGYWLKWQGEGAQRMAKVVVIR